MAIELVNGRPRSVRTEEELAKEILDSLEAMSPDEQAAFLYYLDELEKGNGDVLDPFVKAEYIEEPVDPLTFLLDEYYLGQVGSHMWPKLQEDFVELFEGDYSEAILTGSLGWGKCVTGDTEVYDLSSGERRRVDQAGAFDVASMGEGWSIRPASAIAAPSGRKLCIRVVLADGRAVSLSRDHKVFTGRGWVEAGGLTMGDLVAVAREAPEPRRPVEVTDEKVKLVAYMASDGGLAGSGVTFTNAEPVVLREVADCVEAVGDVSKNGGRWKEVGTSVLGQRGKATTIGLKGVRWFAREAGLTCKATNKRLPAWTYGLPRRQVALFINRFWACDGSVSPKAPQKVETTLASERLIDDLQFLLSRLGVLSRKSYKLSFYVDDDGDRRSFDSWKLTVTGADNILAFLDDVGDILGKENACVALRDACSSVTPNSNTDVVPVNNDVLREMRHESGITNLTGRYGVSGRWMGRRRFQRLCHETGYDGDRAWLADSMIAWEGVRSIEDVGEQDVYDLSVDETHNFVGNGIVLHNSFFATCGLAYILYQMSCLANPQEVYGLATGTALAVAILSATREAARRVPLAELGSKLHLSPYFKEKCPYKIAATMYEIRFPTKKMMVVAGSTSSAAIGTNVFSGFLDEMAFMGGRRQLDRTGRLVEVDKSEVLTKAIVRRMKSRFMKSGKLPGLMFLVSSKEKPVAFIEHKIEEARSGQAPDVFVRDYSTWDVKPQENFSGKVFQIAVGNETIRSKIDPTEDDKEWYEGSGLRIIEAPEEYRPDFESDLEGALRDIAGIATESTSLFIHRREKIIEAIDESLASPVDVEEWMSGDPLEFWWERVAIPFQRSIPGGFTEEAWRPIRHPGAVRYVHIDPSLVGDCAGLVIAHIAGHTEVLRRDAGGETYTEVAPVIETDLMLRIIPPPGDEIFLGDIRGIVYEFQAHGFQIAYASMDSYQSADTRQQFKHRGIESDILSVDKTTVPYEAMKTALYEGRLRLQDHVLVQQELRALQRVQKTKGVIPKFMVDHPPRGTKDIADGIAGVTHSLMTRQPGMPIAPMTSERHSSNEVRDDSWVTGGKVMVPPSAGVKGTKQGMVGRKVSAKDMPMPFTRG